MRVFKCPISGQEFYSDAKPIHEDVDGMVWVESKEATEGGTAVDTGGGNAFGGGAEDDVDDCEETKLDHFWQFEHLENEVVFKSFKKFKKEYYVFFVDGMKRMVKEGKFSEEQKAALKDNLKLGLAWVEENFDSLQFFSVPTYVDDYEEYPDKDGDACLFGAHMAYLLHNEHGARFYFVRDAFCEEKF